MITNRVTREVSKRAIIFHQKLISTQNYKSKYQKYPNFLIKYSFCPELFSRLRKGEIRVKIATEFKNRNWGELLKKNQNKNKFAVSVKK